MLTSSTDDHLNDVWWWSFSKYKAFLKGAIKRVERWDREQMPMPLQGDQENILLPTLKNTEQQLDSYRIEWQEDKSKTLQEKEQEWEEKESSMKSKLEDLESQEEKEEKVV